jgi:hypothetical protein
MSFTGRLSSQSCNVVNNQTPAMKACLMKDFQELGEYVKSSRCESARGNLFIDVDLRHNSGGPRHRSCSSRSNLYYGVAGRNRCKDYLWACPSHQIVGWGKGWTGNAPVELHSSSLEAQRFWLWRVGLGTTRLTSIASLGLLSPPHRSLWDWLMVTVWFGELTSNLYMILFPFQHTCQVWKPRPYQPNSPNLHLCLNFRLSSGTGLPASSATVPCCETGVTWYRVVSRSFKAISIRWDN